MFLHNFAKVLYTLYWKKKFSKIGKHSYIKPFGYFFTGTQYIAIGDNVIIGGGVQLTAWDIHGKHSFMPTITIGDGTNLGSNNHISAINEIRIGKNVLTGKNVLITDNSHGNVSSKELNIPPSKRTLYSKGKVIIEDNVWIGEKATILPNVRIGKSSIIGANSVVTKDIPPYCVACGNPARIIKQFNVE